MDECKPLGVSSHTFLLSPFLFLCLALAGESEARAMRGAMGNRGVTRWPWCRGLDYGLTPLGVLDVFVSFAARRHPHGVRGHGTLGAGAHTRSHFCST